jgi:hypothetical protein
MTLQMKRRLGTDGFQDGREIPNQVDYEWANLFWR